MKSRALKIFGSVFEESKKIGKLIQPALKGTPLEAPIDVFLAIANVVDVCTNRIDVVDKSLTILQSAGDNKEAMERAMIQISGRLEVINTNLLVNENADLVSESEPFTKYVVCGSQRSVLTHDVFSVLVKAALRLHDLQQKKSVGALWDHEEVAGQIKHIVDDIATATTDFHVRPTLKPTTMIY